MTVAQRSGVVDIVDSYIRGLEAPRGEKPSNLGRLEEDFIGIAAGFSRQHGIAPETWLDVGVSRHVLRRARIVVP